jgi:hypothetical protein
MAVRQGSGDDEGILQGGRGGSQRAGQGRAEGFNLMGGEMSDVGDGASLDFAVLAVGFAEEDGGGRVAVGHGGDVHAYIIHKNTLDTSIIHNLHAYTDKNHLSFSKSKGFASYRLELRTNPKLIVWAQRLRSNLKNSGYANLGEDHAALRQQARQEMQRLGAA